MQIINLNGETIGPLIMAYLDVATLDPIWAVVDVGQFMGRIISRARITSESPNFRFVPLLKAWETDDGILVPYTTAKIGGAPMTASPED